MRQLKNIFPWFIHARVIRSGCQALLLMILCTAPPLHAAERQHIESMRQSVLALDSARQTALDEISSSTLSREENDDYKDFIAYLNTRIVNYCMELTEQGGATAVQDLPCPEAPISGKSANGEAATEETFIYLPVFEPQETHTRAEQTASMDQQLFAALGEFDELLLKEEEKVSARVPSQRESGSNGRGGSSGSGGSSGGTGGSGAGTGEQGGDGTTTADAGETGAGSAETAQTARNGSSPGTESTDGAGAGAGDARIDHSTYGAPGGKLPPPEDDDIVARQLREAAEKETDPELKKKLWEEYWKYKGVKKGE